MTFNQIIHKVNKTFKSCVTVEQLNTAKRYSYMLASYFYNDSYMDANVIFNYIDSKFTEIMGELC